MGGGACGEDSRGWGWGVKTSAGSDMFRPQKKRIMRQASGLERPTDVRAAVQQLGRTQRRGHHSRARDTPSPSGQPGTPRHPVVSHGHPVTQWSARALLISGQLQPRTLQQSGLTPREVNEILERVIGAPRTLLISGQLQPRTLQLSVQSGPTLTMRGQ